MPNRPGPESPLARMVAEGDRLMAQRRFADAQALFARACSVEPRNAALRVKLSLAERALGRLAAAEAEAQRAVRLAPQLFLGHYALGLALHAQGHAEQAARAYQRAIRIEPRFPDLPYLLGVALHDAGRVADASAAFRQALALRPDYPDAMAGLAATLILTSGYDEAEALLRTTIRLDPQAAEAHANLAALRVRAGDLDEGLSLYARAAELAPERLDIRVHNADLLERQGRWREAQARLDAAPEAARLPEAALVLARIARRDGRLEDALAALETARRSADRMAAGEADILAGQILDAQGRAAEAFAHLETGNRNLAAAMGVDLAAPPAFLGEIAAARKLLSPDLARATPPPPGAAPVFLVGFPRSGTTLLEQVLEGHPGVQAMEERPAVAAVRTRLADIDVPLGQVTDAQIEALRAAYFAEADRHVARRPDRLLVDKLPLNLIWTPLIWRIFPDARFILALRHPVDACLGCFMQHFAMNAAMSSFLSLESTATVYAEVMGLWRDVRASLPLSVHAVKYEDVVEDLPAQAAALLRFLDLPWDDAVLDTAATAQSRRVLNTPSYHQVSRPIYRDAAYRFRRYGALVDGVAAKVAPFVRMFGYA